MEQPRISEIVAQELHAAIEAQGSARRALHTAVNLVDEAGPDTLSQALTTLLRTSVALERTLLALYESETHL